jgi:hypothetical protein
VNGTLYKLYLELEGFGVVIKQAGTAAANPVTGQLTATFANTPQQPFEDLKLVFKGGPRAPLANPQECGEALMTRSEPVEQPGDTGCEPELRVSGHRLRRRPVQARVPGRHGDAQRWGVHGLLGGLLA